MHLPAAASVADNKLFTSLGRQSVDGRLASAKVMPSLVIVYGYQQTVHKPLMVNRHQWKWCWHRPSCLLLSTECSPALGCMRFRESKRQQKYGRQQTVQHTHACDCTDQVVVCLNEKWCWKLKQKSWWSSLTDKVKPVKKREMTDRVSEGNRT